MVKFTDVVPVIIEHGVEFPIWLSRTMAPVYYALLVSTVDGRQLLLPVLVSILGPRDAPSQQVPIRQWRGNTPGYDGIRRNFAQHPIVRISDVVLAEALESSYEKDPWGRRRFSTTWEIAPILSDVPIVHLRAPNNQHKSPGPLPSTWLRYTSIRLLATRINELVPSVQFRSHSAVQPFDVLKLRDIYFGSGCLGSPPKLVQRISDRHWNRTGKSYFVDDKPSCRFRSTCTSTVLSDAGLCRIHERIISRALAKPKALKRQQSEWTDDTYLRENGYDSDFRWVPPRIHLDRFAELRRMSETYSLWVVDTEFSTVKSANAIPYSICIRDVMSNRIIISTTIDYGSMPLQGLEDRVKEFQDGRLRKIQTAAVARKHYKHTSTHRMRLSEVGQHLRAAGFLPATHRLFSWFSSIDVYIVKRALLGLDDLIDVTPVDDLSSYMDDEGNDAFLVIDISRLLMHCTTLSYCSLGWTLRSMFPGELWVMHTADVDTLAMCRIFRLLLQEIVKWRIV